MYSQQLSNLSFVLQVMGHLEKLFGSLYTDANVMLSATHTHSGPGAYHQYVLFDVTSLGFYEDSLKEFAEGIAEVCKFYNIE